MTSIRKEPLANDCYYHIFTRSISKYIVFNGLEEYWRIIKLLQLYRHVNFDHKYSYFSSLTPESQEVLIASIELERNYLVEIVSYCVMPTHIHLLLKQTADSGISRFINRVLNGYSRYFNAKHHRIGPLWSGRFKSVRVSSDEQLLHLTRYIHLNPSSAGLVLNPEDWIFSSYHEYIGAEKTFCDHDKLIDLPPDEYKKFVMDRKSYQKNLSMIKALLIDEYTG